MRLLKLTPMLLLAAGLCYGTANADDMAPSSIPTLLPASQVIDNLDQALSAAKKECALAMIFPAEAPSVQANKLYANFSFYKHNPDQNKPGVTTCLLTASINQTCATVRCMVISMLVSNENHGNIEKTYLVAPLDKSHKLNKEVVMLDNKITAYYTPGHAEASWIPPALEWTVNNTRYTLIWDHSGKWDAKALLIRMANSAH